MIFTLNKIKKLVKKKNEVVFLFLLIIITIISTTFYNNKKIIINEAYKSTINNTYFQKSISYILNNLTPRYKKIDHKISSGETFDKILNKYSITNDEIIKIKKNLNSDYNLNNLKTGLNIKFTVDEKNNKKITSFIFPVSRTEKIQLSINLENNLYEKKTIITNLNKRIIFK